MLDLGSFSVESDTGLIAQLPQEEAALYECLRLRSRDISAYVVDGEFSFQALEQAGVAELPEVKAFSTYFLHANPFGLQFINTSQL